MRYRQLHTLAFTLLALILNACSQDGVQTPMLTEAVQPTQVLVATTTKPTLSTPESTEQQIVKPSVDIPSSQLGDKGPWLVFFEEWGLWALNPDGSGLTKIFDPGDPILDAVKIHPASHASQVAMVQFDIMGGASPILRIFSIPQGEEIAHIRLLSDEIEEILQDPDRYFEVDNIFASVGPFNALAWSSDGKRLAFNGAMDGPSSDLYLYDVGRQTTTRLTDGSTQSTDPVFWSPDDQTLLQGAAAALGWQASGWGYDMSALWAMRADGSAFTKLVDGGFIGYIHSLGWLTNTDVVIDTEIFPCWYSDARIVDVTSGDARTLLHGHYHMRALDPQSGTLLYVIADVDNPIPECAASMAPGLYIQSIDGSPPVVISELPISEYARLIWSDETKSFFLSDEESLYSIQTNGEITTYPSPRLLETLPVIAPGGQRWALVDEDEVLWIGNAQGDLTQVFSEQVHHPIWSPDGQALFFFSGSTVSSLYLAHESDFIPLLLGEGFFVSRYWGELFWVEP